MIYKTVSEDEKKDTAYYFDMALQMAKDLGVQVTFGRIKEPFFDESAGLYLAEPKHIWISTDVYNIAQPTEGLVFTLVHEIVHAIQHILGAYETFNLPDDLRRIKANEIWKQTLMDEAPIFEVEADEVAIKICHSWGMCLMHIHGGYAQQKRFKKDHEFKNYIWNEIYQLEVEPIDELDLELEKELKEAA